MYPLNTFIAESIKNFIKVGSVVPSSSHLARRMTKNMKGPVVLELGPGTGIFTKEILKKLPKDGILISIESNKEFAKYLVDKIKDSRLRLCIGDALLLRKFLEKNRIKKVDYVISGLPLGLFKKEAKFKILNEISECLKDDGVYVQFQYVLAGIRAIKSIFPNVSVSFEPLNLPPAFVMRCRKTKKIK